MVSHAGVVKRRSISQLSLTADCSPRSGSKPQFTWGALGMRPLTSTRQIKQSQWQFLSMSLLWQEGARRLSGLSVAADAPQARFFVCDKHFAGVFLPCLSIPRHSRVLFWSSVFIQWHTNKMSSFLVPRPSTILLLSNEVSLIFQFCFASG